jgi:hypothetical protein
MRGIISASLVTRAAGLHSSFSGNPCHGESLQGYTPASVVTLAMERPCTATLQLSGNPCHGETMQGYTPASVVTLAVERPCRATLQLQR